MKLLPQIISNDVVVHLLDDHTQTYFRQDHISYDHKINLAWPRSGPKIL